MEEGEVTKDSGSPDNSTSRQLTVPEMVRDAERIRSTLKNDPEFKSRTLVARNEASTIIDAVLAGRLSRDDAAQILGDRSAEAQLTREIDHLTGLPNRGELERRLTETLAIAKRNGLTIAIAFADLDDFKSINDDEEKGGHDRGDAVLSSWGGSIRTCFRRDTDYAGRYGGEEIVFVFLNADEAWATEHMKQLAQSMPDEIREAVQEMGFELDTVPTMTVGVADEKLDPLDSREPAQIAKDLMKKADERMYLGKKKAGKNTIIDSTQERLILENQVA